MSYPWWHIKATFSDGTVKDYQATDLSPLFALKALLTDSEGDGTGLPEPIFQDDLAHGDLVKLEVLHPSTPGLDPATELCPDCTMR